MRLPYGNRRGCRGPFGPDAPCRASGGAANSRRRHRGSGRGGADGQPHQAPAGFAVAIGRIRRRRSAPPSDQGLARSGGHPADQQRRREQLGQLDAELHRRHRQHQPARPRHRLDAGAAERQAAGAVGGADGRWRELRGLGRAGAAAGHRAGGDAQGRRVRDLRLGCRRRRRQLHHPARLRRRGSPPRIPRAHRQRQPGRRQRGRRDRRRRRAQFVSARRQLFAAHILGARRGGLAAAGDERLRQSRQLQRALPRAHGGRPGLRGARRTAAGTRQRQHHLPLRLRAADHRGTGGRASAGLRPRRLGRLRRHAAVERDRLRQKRHQPRSVAELSGAEHAAGAGAQSRQHLRRRRAVPGPPLRRRPTHRDQLLPARHRAPGGRRGRRVRRRRVPGTSRWCMAPTTRC